MKIKPYIYWILVTICLMLYFVVNHQYMFYYFEQLQLFVISPSTFMAKVAEPGGLMLYAAGLLTQFFKIPICGPLFIAILLSAISMLVWRIAANISQSCSLYAVALLPTLLFIPLHTDEYYRIQGTMSFLLMLVFLLMYVSIKDYRLKIVAAICITPMLYWCSGAMFTLFVLSVIIIELFVRSRFFYVVIVSVIIEWTAIIMASRHMGLEMMFEKIALPTYYNDPLVVNDSVYYPWIAYLLVLIFYFAIRNKRISSGWISFGLQSILTIGVFIGIYNTADSAKEEDYKLDYHLRNAEWNEIISMFNPKGQYTNSSLSVLNLALAKSGRLGDSMFGYPQISGESLYPNWNSTLRQAIILSEIAYHVGDIASAKEYAMEGSVASLGGNPRLMQILILSELITGDYRVAEKYMNILDKTIFYRSWVKDYRKYLYNDDLVNADQELGGKRKAIQSNLKETTKLPITQIWENLATSNPKNELPFHYLIAYNMLNKHLKEFDKLHQKYYRSEVWDKMAQSHQEAIIALYQDEPILWPRKGVSNKKERQFMLFDQDMRANNSKPNFVEIMKESYGDTYWFYLMFNNNSTN